MRKSGAVARTQDAANFQALRHEDRGRLPSCATADGTAGTVPSFFKYWEYPKRQGVREPLLARPLPALLRAPKRAEELAAATNTAIVDVVDGKVVHRRAPFRESELAK